MFTIIFLFLALFGFGFLYLLYFLSWDKSDLLDDESENDGTDYGSSNAYYF